MKQTLILIASLTLATNAFALFGMEEKYQHDADIFRLRHIKYFGNLIEEFHQKTGAYPLQGKSKHPHYVHIAAPPPAEICQDRPTI